MDSDRDKSESLLHNFNVLHKIDEVSQPSQPSPPVGGTDGNDRDNISKDEVGGPDELSYRVNDLHEKLQNHLSDFKSTLEVWLREVDVLDSEVSSMTESQDVKSLDPNNTLEDKLRAMGKDILSLKLNLPALRNVLEAKWSTPGLLKNVADARIGKMLKLQKEFNKQMSGNLTTLGLQQLYDSLRDLDKKCLLCLTAFPENAIIKKRVLINWWAGEKFLDVQDPKEPMATEKGAESIFTTLSEKGFIMLVHKKPKQRSPVPDSCQLHPFMRQALITLAKKDNFLDFDSQGNATAKYAYCSRACLVEGGQIARTGGKLLTLINTSEQFLDFRLGSFNECKVLQLGRWVVSSDHNIHVDDEQSLLRGMGTMKSLTYLSLQGVTKIRELPASICRLSNLTILDLGACQSLETLPRAIGSLKKLEYLDFSECYLISHMPRSLAELGELQVLKGFVLYHHENHQNESGHRGEACTLSDLERMQKLWKLSLRVDGAEELGDQHIKDLSKLPQLRSLTITWVQAPARPGSSDRNLKRNQKKGKSKHPLNNPSTTNNSDSNMKLHKLTKLDLRGYPAPAMPKWLIPAQVKNLKKLYIIGGKLANLNQRTCDKDRWPVEILRLKFLADLEIKWLDLRARFPYLVYLQKFRCPKLKFFPCDEYGVWMNPHPEKQE